MQQHLARASLAIVCATSLASGASTTVQVQLQAQGNRESGVHLVSDAQVDRAAVGGGFPGFSLASSLPGNRSKHAAVVSGGYAYVFGGYDPSGAPGNTPAEVYYAPLTSSGAPGVWKTTTPLPAGRLSPGAVAYNGFLYCAGGFPGGTGVAPLKEVLVATINSDGSLGAWRQAGDLPQPRVAMALLAAGNSIYSLGGDLVAAQGTTDVLAAQVRADGTLSSWAAQSRFAGTRVAPAVFSWGNRVYVASGQSGGSFQTDVQSAPLLADGSVGTWVTTTPLAAGVTGARAVAFDNFVVLAGGALQSGPSELIYAPILASGRLGSWASHPASQARRQDHAAFAHESTLVLIGGQLADGSTSSRDTLYSTLTPAQPSDLGLGGVAGWDPVNGLPASSGRRLLAVAASSTALYAVGGVDASVPSGALAEVWVAPLGPNGQGAFAQTSFLGTARFGLAAVVAGGFLYAIGGTDSQGNALDTIEAAPILADGKLGSFKQVSVLPEKRTLHAAVVAGSSLYVVGGAGTPTVKMAALKGDGTLGPWSFAQTLPAPRQQLAALVYRGRLYVAGGSDDGTNVKPDVWWATVNPNGGLSAWNTDGQPLPAGRSGHGLVALNGQLLSLGGNGTTEDVLVADLHDDGSVGNWTNTVKLTPPRRDLGAAAANGFVYIVGGADFTGNTLYSDAQQAAVVMPALRGSWSGTVTFPQPIAALDSLTLSGTPVLPDGIATVEWLNAGASGVYGGGGSVSRLAFGAPISFPASGVQTLWLRVTLDESAAGAADSTPARLSGISLSVRASVPTRLAFASGPQTVVVGACSQQVALQLQDAGGQVALAPSGGVTASLSGGVGFYSDGACRQSISSVTIAAGSSTAGFYFKAASLGAVSINASASGLLPAAQIETTVVGAPARLIFHTQPADVQVGAPFAPPVQVGVADAQNNPITSGTFTITLALVNGGGAGLSGTLSASAVAGIASFPRVSLDKAGVNYRLAATSQPALEPGLSRSFQVLSGPVASKLAFTSAAQTLAQSRCSAPATVQLEDDQGRAANASENIQVQLVAQAGSGDFFVDAACSTQAGGLTIQAGASKASFYFRGNTTGSLRILANAAGLQDTSQAETITAPTGADGGTDNSHRTINGFACSSGGGGGTAAWVLVALLAGLWARRGKRRAGPAAAALLAVLLAAEARADTAAPFVAVLELHNRLPRGQRAQVDAGYLTDVVRSALLREVPGVRLMSRDTMGLLLKGLAHRQCGDSCDLDFGKRLEVDYVVSGDVVRLGATYKVALKLLSVADGHLASAAEGAGKSPDELDKNAREAVQELVKSVSLRGLVRPGPIEPSKGEGEQSAAADPPVDPPLPILLPMQEPPNPPEAKAEEKPEAEVEPPPPPLVTAEEPPPPLPPPSPEAAVPPLPALPPETAAHATGPSEIAVAAQPAPRRWYIPDLFVAALADPAARTFGQELAVILHPSEAWAAQLGLTISPDPGVRVQALRRLGQLGEARFWAGPQIHVAPVTDGVAVGGGLGARAEMPLMKHLDAVAGVALVAYAAPSDFIFAPLVQVGFIIRL